MNILIIKIGALGDVLRTSFIAQALKDKYQNKNPKIFWITSKIAFPIFLNNPYVDKLIQKENKDELKKINFDLIINLEEDEENCRYIGSLNGKEKIGFLYKGGKIVPSKSAEEWFNMSALGKKPYNDILKKKNKKTHRQIIGEMLDLKWEKYPPFLRLTQKQRKFSQDFLRRHNLNPTDFIMGINTGSADRWPKALPIKKTAELINLLYKKFNAKILLFGGPNEVDRNKDILKYTKVPVTDTGCDNDLEEFPSLISACNIVVTSDSLGLHVALALKRKVICLVGPTSPSELDMYGLGKKVLAKSKDVCSYKTKSDCMNKIDLNEVVFEIKNLMKQKITFLITAFKEPNVWKAIDAVLNQKTKYKFEIVVSAPDKDTLDIADKYLLKHKNIRVIKDPGKGKSYALNLLFKKIDTGIFILSDGDVYVSENSVEEIVNLFRDPEIGCVTGRPVPTEDKKTKYGYWANFLFDAAYRIRKNAFENNSFIECSGYLFAFRKKEIDSVPLDVAEDTFIPYSFWEKGYKIGYAEKALVYVKNPRSLGDWMKQKIRTSKAHETLEKYVDIKTTPRVKSFWNEAKGVKMLISYPKNIMEFFWTIELIFARFFMWGKVFFDTKIRNKHYGDAWERVESTK